MRYEHSRGFLDLRNAQSLTIGLISIIFLGGASASGENRLSVTLTPSAAAPQLVGTQVSFTSAATGFSGTVDYRFSTRPAGGSFQVARDYATFPTFTWAATEAEGTYEIAVTALELQTGRTTQTSILYAISPRVLGSAPILSKTLNTLIALYSAPACAAGATMNVQFWIAGSPQQNAFTTPSKTCGGVTTMNFYLAGMRALTTYQVQHQLTQGGVTVKGPLLSFQSGALPSALPQATIVSPPTSNTAVALPVLVHSFGFGFDANTAVMPSATDLAGNYIWYNTYSANSGAPATTLRRTLPGGHMLLNADDPNNPNSTTNRGQLIREIDIAGNIVMETNATRVSAEVAALGGKDRLTQFNHEVIRLANGHTLALVYAERMYPAGTQGATAPVDILGLYVVDLDPNLTVTWFWCGFDHLDINRAAILGEQCTNQIPLCPTLYLAPIANDWLHGNALDVAPDGGLLISLRDQDWIIKVDYANGTGAGGVLWHLGKDGDFTITSTDPYPWFSHQHEAQYELGGSTILSLFDNGDTRRTLFPTSNSRGMVLQINEATRSVIPILSADLGNYSMALGSAQRLPNGNYSFCSGWIQPDKNVPAYTQSIEVLPSGTLNYIQQTSATTYRTFRQRDMYASVPGAH